MVVNPPLPRNVKLAMRSMVRTQNSTSILVNGPFDPPPIVNDIVVEKVVEVVPTTGTSLTLTYSNLYKLLDTQTTAFFTAIRAIKVSVYGPTTTGTTVPVSLSVNYDGAYFTDRNSGSLKGANLHVRLPQFVRETWVATTSATGIAVVSWQTGNYPVIQATIQVRANNSGDT